VGRSRRVCDQGVIVNTALADPLLCAVIVAAVLDPTREVVTVKLALVWPAGTTMLPGGVAAALLLDKNTPRPPAGAAMFSVTVPVEEVPPLTLDGLNESDETPGLAGPVWHIPVEPHTCPPGQPHASVPPQPSGAEHWPAGRSTQLFGVHPAVTVSGFATVVFAGSPDVALMFTTVVCGTEFAAWIVSAPPPVVHPGWMTGWPFAITEATAGLLLVT
jgi:hypothetical protein